MRVVWSPRALKRLIEIHDYIANDKPEAAARVARTIRQTVDRLETHPNIGRPGRIEPTKELVIPRTPYIVAYFIEQNTVNIVDVLHGAQLWDLPNPK